MLLHTLILAATLTSNQHDENVSLWASYVILQTQVVLKTREEIVDFDGVTVLPNKGFGCHVTIHEWGTDYQNKAYVTIKATGLKTEWMIEIAKEISSRTGGHWKVRGTNYQTEWKKQLYGSM